MKNTIGRLSVMLLSVTLAACGAKEDKTVAKPADSDEEPTYAGKILGALDRTAIEKTRSDMVSIGTALTAGSTARGSFPDVDFADLPGEIAPTFIRRLPMKDAWGSQFVYDSDGESWELTAPGADGEAGTGDDIIYEDGVFTKLPDGYRDM